MAQYKGPESLKVPELNPEPAIYLRETVIKRDNFFKEFQQTTLATIVTLGAKYVYYLDVSLAMSNKFRLDLVAITTEALQLQAEQFFEHTECRKAFISPTITNPEVKKLLQQQKTDALLFGKDLAEKIADLNKVKKTASQLREDKKPTFGKPPKSARDFYKRRHAHPRHANGAWSGTGQLDGQWTSAKPGTKHPNFNNQTQGQQQQQRARPKNFRKPQ